MSEVQYIVDVTAEDASGRITVVGYLGPYDTTLGVDQAANYPVAMTVNELATFHGYVPVPYRGVFGGEPVHGCTRYTIVDGVRDELSGKELW